MEEAGRIMLRYGLDGLVVIDGDDIVGVVSRRDIDQASHHKLGHAPVQGFMSKPVLTIGPDTPLSEIQRMMICEDIGRLPVVDAAHKLVGIVSRHEVLNALYGSASADPRLPFSPGANPLTINVRDRLEALPETTRWLFSQIGTIAARQNMVAYAVGGCVRDLFLGLPNFDLDFVVEGKAIELACALETAFPSRLELVARHDRFQTATLVFHEAVRREVDLSTARTEFYEYPAALPEVEASGLQQDLFRRDFTINALAVCLNPGRYGELIDYFGGLADLEAKQIRILHPFSFIEDPTRIVRAARFAARLGFDLDIHSREQAERAISMGIFDGLGGVRLRTELKLILESPQRMRGLELLGQMGGRLRYLDPDLEFGATVRKQIRWAERLLERYPVADDWVVYLGILLSQLPLAKMEQVADRLHLSNAEKEHIVKGVKLPGQVDESQGELPRSRVFQLLHGLSDHSLAVAACLATTESALRRMIKVYLEELRDVKVIISGAELLRMGVPEGPAIGRIIARLTEAKLDGSVVSLEEELAFVRTEVGAALDGNRP